MTARTLLLRADANGGIGSGHVMRCLALAQAWQAGGGRAALVGRVQPAAFAARLPDDGLTVGPLDADPGSDADADATAAEARRLGAEWVVVDGYHFGSGYQRRLKEAGLRVLALDDYGHAAHDHADLVLNQNLHAAEGLYPRRSTGTRLLLGTRFALLRREFWRWGGWRREVAPAARRILVSFGGGDPDNVTRAAIGALGQAGLDGAEAVAVVGASNPHAETLEAAARRSPVQVRLRRDARDMAELMAWADLAVGAAGSTVWERAFLGLPGVLVVLADNQEAVADACQAAGVGVNLGRPGPGLAAALARTVGELAGSRDARATQSARGQQLVDGYGGERVCAALAGRRLWLRPALPGDVRLLWEWAADPAVRQSAFNTDPIPWDDHQAWFARKLADPECRILLGFDEDDAPRGQIRFDRVCTREAEVAVCIDPGRRGSGLGAELIRAGVGRVLQDGWVCRVHAFIKPENEASLRAFDRAGFRVQGREAVRGHDAVHAVRECADG